MRGGIIEAAAELDIPERLNAATFFVDANVEAGRGDRVAIRYTADDSEHTYAEVLDAVNRTGNALRELGVDAEQRVALLLLDTPEFAAAFFGAIKAGLVPVPLNTLLKRDDYGFLLADSRARALVVSAPLLPTIASLLGQLEYLRHVIVASNPPGMEGPGVAGAIEVAAEHCGAGVAVHDLAVLQASAPAELTPADLNRDDVAFWLYSSGTTGFPKGAVHLQHDMLVCAQTFGRQVLDVGPDDVSYSVAKLFFAYGLGNALYIPFWFGGTTVLHPGRPEPAAVFDILLRYRPSIFYSVPTGYGALLAHADAPGREELTSLRACVSAGEALPASLMESWRARYGVDILDGIGSTELLHVFIANRPGEVMPGSSGKIVPGYGARIVDEYGSDVPVGEVGDLLVRGDSTCAYYWNRHEQTKDTIAGHWIRTGDKFRVDEEGWFWFQGRADDMLKVSGIWVSPFEVEAALLEHPSVLEAAVIGAAGDDRLVKPKAFVVLGDDGIADEAMTAELKAFVKERIAPYKYPRWIEFVDELPKTATGKIQRYLLR